MNVSVPPKGIKASQLATKVRHKVASIRFSPPEGD